MNPFDVWCLTDTSAAAQVPGACVKRLRTRSLALWQRHNQERRKPWSANPRIIPRSETICVMFEHSCKKMVNEIDMSYLFQFEWTLSFMLSSPRWGLDKLLGQADVTLVDLVLALKSWQFNGTSVMIWYMHWDCFSEQNVKYHSLSIIAVFHRIMGIREALLKIINEDCINSSNWSQRPSHDATSLCDNVRECSRDFQVHPRGASRAANLRQQCHDLEIRSLV